MMNKKIIPENIFQETIKKENQNDLMFDKDHVLRHDAIKEMSKYY